jgi:uncharacterized protein
MILDSLCITSWRARPASFVSLMTLYESNFIRLQALVGDIRRHEGSKVSCSTGDCDLHLTVLEHAPLHLDGAAHLCVPGRRRHHCGS